ncbi:hypothetical protein D3C72_975360 [compost metagenome]
MAGDLGRQMGVVDDRDRRAGQRGGQLLGRDLGLAVDGQRQVVGPVQAGSHFRQCGIGIDEDGAPCTSIGRRIMGSGAGRRGGKRRSHCFYSAINRGEPLRCR